MEYMYMYICVYRNIFFALYSWGILQASFDIIFFLSQAVFKNLCSQTQDSVFPWFSIISQLYRESGLAFHTL